MYSVNTMVRLTPKYKKMMTEYLDGNPKGHPEECDNEYYRRFINCSSFVYLGEIVNMPGHGVYAGRNGVTYVGFHPEDFEEIPEEEV